MIEVKEKPLPRSVLQEYPPACKNGIYKALDEKLACFGKKIVVLDDDPTGVQTVHDIPVFTNWQRDTITQAFREEGSMFFILTNSRSMTTDQSKSVHIEIAKTVFDIAGNEGKEFIFISRSDSTLRGHYPLETMVLKSTLEELGHPAFDGEIIFPFFMEGGRFTVGNIHYVREGEILIPAALTEFAKDKSFGYSNSFLPNWCEEKTNGEYKAEDIVCISLDDLRAGRVGRISDQLRGVHNFGKVIVNSISYEDVAVFILAFLDAAAEGMHFMYRSAAAVTKILGGVTDQPFLSREKLISSESQNGGIVLVGSHVNKTTEQLRLLLNSDLLLSGIEFNVKAALEKGGLERETARAAREANTTIKEGRTAVIFTSRERLYSGSEDKDAQVELIARISDAVTGVIAGLKVQPAFIVAKGGITSSDAGTKALGVRRAMVMGQVSPGVPVWLTGPESRFPNMPFIIFPGNVGEAGTLREIIALLTGEK